MIKPFFVIETVNDVALQSEGNVRVYQAVQSVGSSRRIQLGAVFTSPGLANLR